MPRSVIRAAICCGLLAAARLAVAAPTTDPAPADAAIAAFRKLANFEYERTPESDPAEGERLRADLCRMLAGRVDPATCRQLFDPADPAAMAAAADRVRAALPGPADWYLSATVDPLPADPRRPEASVICGVVARRETQTVTLGGPPMPIDVVWIAGGAVRGRRARLDTTIFTEVVGPRQMVVYQQEFDAAADNWVAARSKNANNDLEQARQDICSETVGPRPWEAIGQWVMVRTLEGTQPDQVRSVLWNSELVRAAGKLEALQDRDFVFAVTRGGFTTGERDALLALRGRLTLLCYGDYPEVAIAKMAHAATETISGQAPAGEQPTTLTAAGHEILLDYLGDGLAGIDDRGGEPPRYKLGETLLPATLDRDRLRSTARRLCRKWSAETNERLAAHKLNHEGAVAPEDRVTFLALVDRSLAAYPDGNYTRLASGQADLQVIGREAQGVKLLTDLADHCDVATVAAAADLALGKDDVRQGRFTAAGKRLSAADKLEPKNAETLYWLFKARLGSGDYAEARRAREAFLDVEPTGRRADDVRAVNVPEH